VSAPAGPFDVSVVTAVYNVERYLPDFAASLEGQRGVDLSRVQVVAVDDGSTDGSLAWLQEWAQRSPLDVTVLTKENGGQATARNLGMTAARGTWLTFTDPDDTLEAHYLKRVLSFAAKHPEVEMVATARWIHHEATGTITDTHPLRHMFGKDALINLDEHEHYFYGSAPCAFFRRERVEALGLRFDERIRSHFEDGHFCGRYLLAAERPMVGFLRSAVYNYRKRSDGSSTLNASLLNPERYIGVPKLGYLDLFEQAREARGHVPRWIQTFVLYDLSWYFSAETAASGTLTAAKGETAKQFLALLAEICAQLEPELVDSFNARRFDSVWRDIVKHAVQSGDWHGEHVVIGPRDPGRELIRVAHRFSGKEPSRVVRIDGRESEPVHSKIRAHRLFDHDLLLERISWFPLGEVTASVDGQELEVLRKWPRPPSPEAEAEAPWRRSRWGRRLLHPVAAVTSVRRRATRRVLTSPLVGRSYRDAWVLMDRIHDADDSGEHLFRYLRAHRPDINAWFVVEKGTPDWRRLRPEYGRRVVAHDSWRWLVLMLNCINLISSHVDRPVHRPHRVMQLLKGRRTPWRFSFLQHGVIKDDLSQWLNPKAVHLFVTSTVGEQASIVGDGTAYTYTTREAKLIGLPRFDRLLAAVDEVEGRDLVLIAPTWRQWLMPPLQLGSQRRELNEDFLETGYARNWLGLLRSPELAAVCHERGLTLGFLPHPNLQSMHELVALPDHVRPLSFTDGNVQQLFARSALLVTDYSSMAFNAAYLDRAVVYFQFDADLVRGGGHVGRAGYFDYERDGFGPVVSTLPEAIDAISASLERGGVPTEQYLKRNADTFLLRDGKCCERATAAIEALRRPDRRP
jgi:glycosyltransferase involved in cell wall biosynthesis